MQSRFNNLSDHPVVVIILVTAAVVSIFVFVTGRPNFPTLLQRLTRSNANQRKDPTPTPSPGSADRTKEENTQAQDESTSAEGPEQEVQSWSTSLIENQTNFPILYDVQRENGSWEAHRLQPNVTTTITLKNSEISIKYDGNTASGYQERTYQLQSLTTMGRKPSQSEIDSAPRTWFALENNGDIVMYCGCAH